MPRDPHIPPIPVRLQQLRMVHVYANLVLHQPNEDRALSKTNHGTVAGKERGLNQQETG